MLRDSGMALDAAQIERARSRNQIIISKAEDMGYKFIRLRAIDQRLVTNTITGADMVRGIPFVNEKMGNMTDYYIEQTGGEIKFELDTSTGTYVCFILDTEKNRQFLATHKEHNFWRIMDEMVEADVEERYNKIKDSFIRKDMKMTPEMAEEKPSLPEAIENPVETVASINKKMKHKGGRPRKNFSGNRFALNSVKPAEMPVPEPQRVGVVTP